MPSRFFALALLIVVAASGCGLLSALADGAVDAGAPPGSTADAAPAPDDEDPRDGGRVETDAGAVDAGPALEHRVRLRFDRGAPSEPLVGFPLMVRLTPARAPLSELHAEQSLRFVDDDGVTVLAHEIERFDTEEVIAWVRVPEIDATGEDFIWLEIDVDHEFAASTPALVWQDEFAGVWHLGGNVNDSLRQAHGSQSATSDVEGPIAGAKRLTGGAFVELPASGCGDTEAGTVSLWLRLDPLSEEAPTEQMLFYFVQPEPVRGNQDGFGGDDELHAFVTPDGRPGFFIENAGMDGDLRVEGSAPLADGGWHHLAVTWERGGEGRLLVDGAQTSGIQGAWGAFTPGRCFLGRALAGARSYSGELDDVRVSTVARSVAWIEAEIASGKDALVSFGEVETPLP